MSDTHTLIIKFDTDPLGHEPSDVDYSIECPEITDACRMWVECDIPGCGSEDAVRDHKKVIHGKRHQLIASTWSIPTDTCYLLIADELCDAADFLATKLNLGPGRYTVGHDFDEGMVAELTLVEAESP